MRDALAEKLLATMLGWSPAEVAQERPILQALAAYKYDEYHQFSAGGRFVESLALWLNQFRTTEERRTAYEFVMGRRTAEESLKGRLVYCSEPEMRHLVEVAYPDHVRPALLSRVAAEYPGELGTSQYRVGRIAASRQFAAWQRRTLFLGLSDGARIDAFRRANRDLNHEQIWQTYELSKDRVSRLLEKLSEHLAQILGRPPTAEERSFRTLVLIDDFSAGGTSYYAPKQKGKMGGKVAAFFDAVCKGANPVSKLIDRAKIEVVILLYMATQTAAGHLRQCSEKLWGGKQIPSSVHVVQELPDTLRVTSGGGEPIAALIQNYYPDEDHKVLFDSHLKKGGTTDARYGYAAGGLPVVLHHNTPNNSIALLWSYEGCSIRGLFPRVQRHKEMS